MRDWREAPYSRVYATLALDHPLIWDDDRLLAWWLRLLRGADAAYPGPAPLPRALPDDVLEALQGERIIEPHGSSGYRFHGLTDERDGRSARGRAGGLARAASAERREDGTLGPTLAPDAGADAGAVSSSAGPHAGSLNGSSAGASTLVAPAGAPAHQRDETSQDEASAPTRLGSSPPRAPAREGRGAPTEGTIRCNAYHQHQHDHVLIPGVGWKCPVCEAEWARSDESFDQKVRAQGELPF